tara:strand:- start:341 stop:583 length:243 start_codon:yes stop_codon:yes gene_type:complete
LEQVDLLYMVVMELGDPEKILVLVLLLLLAEAEAVIGLLIQNPEILLVVVSLDKTEALVAEQVFGIVLVVEAELTETVVV